MDRNIYDIKLLEIISYKTKFRFLNSDTTVSREGKLQRYLRNLKNINVKFKKCFSDSIYDEIYPCGSRPARIYGPPKMHKLTYHTEVPLLYVPLFRLLELTITNWLCL